MNLKLSRTAFKETGIYGEIESAEDGKKLFFTIEHAFPGESASGKFWYPIIPIGTYKCIRGQHKLHNGIPFETFMVTGIEGHTGVLFHIGNYNKDSEGCICLGKAPMVDGVNRSGEAFKEFIELQRTTDEFMLEVV